MLIMSVSEIKDLDFLFWCKFDQSQMKNKTVIKVGKCQNNLNEQGHLNT